MTTTSTTLYVKQGNDWFLVNDDKSRDRIAPAVQYLNAHGNYCLFVDGAIRKVWDVFEVPKRKDATIFQTVILPMPPKAEQRWCYDVDEETGCVAYVAASEAVGKPYKTYQGALNYSQEITQEIYYDLYCEGAE